MGIVASEDVAENADATEATGNTNGAIGNIIDATAAFAGTAYHYYHGNERMDVEYITDEAGKVVNGYTYDAFGTIVTSSEKLQNRYTYNGEAFDKTTEQYYLRKRFYNPKLSRFIQEDEYRGDGLNLYAFCANNPVMYVDPSGYAKKCGTDSDSDVDDAKSKRGYSIVECDDPAVNEVLSRVTEDNAIPNYSKNSDEFQRWFNELSCDDLDILYSNQDVKDIIKDQLRGSNGKHEFLNVANANIFKRWGATAEDIMNQTTYTKDTFFDNILTNDGITKVSGPHTRSSAGKYAHQEMDALVKSSNSMQEYVDSLRIWADTDNHLRVETSNGTLIGSEALPGFLKKGEALPDNFK